MRMGTKGLREEGGVVDIRRVDEEERIVTGRRRRDVLIGEG